MSRAICGDQDPDVALLIRATLYGDKLDEGAVATVGTNASI